MNDGSDNVLTLGLAGCGRLAMAGYLPALAAVAGEARIRLVAVADPDPERRAAVAAEAGRGPGGGAATPDRRAALAAQARTGPGGGVATFPDVEALLAGAAVDGLVLATPAATHLADAERATSAGVAVLVEKPPAPDAARAALLAALAPPPWVGFNRRFDPGARAVRSVVPADGPVGLRLEIRYRRRSWGAHAVRDDALLDLGPHLVDWARWITGHEVVEVACSALSPERLTAEVRLAGGGRATVVAATDRAHAELIEVRDRAGRLVARHRLGGLVAGVAGRLGLGGGADALVTSLAGQLTAFAAAIRGRPPADLATGADGHAAMAVVDAARASAAASGRPTPVPHPADTS